MARPSKIEQLDCQDIVAAGVRNGKSMREIAVECSEWAGEKISHTAVERYIKTLREKKGEVVKSDERAVMNIVHQDFDIIQTNLKMTKRLLERYEFIDDLPEYFKEQMDELVHTIRDEREVPTDFLEKWSAHTFKGFKRKVYEITTMAKETREQVRLMMDLKERVYKFELMSEFLNIFMSIYQKHDPEAFERAMQEVSANPRMAQIVEQQRAFTEGKGGI